jgi:hypothetical protein
LRIGGGLLRKDGEGEKDAQGDFSVLHGDLRRSLPAQRFSAVFRDMPLRMPHGDTTPQQPCMNHAQDATL